MSWAAAGRYTPKCLARACRAEPLWAEGARYPQAQRNRRVGAPQFAAGRAVAPELALPVYLRDKVALTLEEQRAR